ncbi:cell wall-binding repeat-containing protein [Candidatus Poriferisodalis sp.]|uniref:cell wall-binding repeat-containing protein n=1 Tax=Candidatus Poriferisodalis sp. TaxID=3101277 RepID=UPI003B529855
MLMASVLAVVAGSPVQAANTSQEALVDTNDDGVGDAREFGGRDRYDTALRLAKNFADGRGGLGGVPTAFVASGLSLVDAVSVSGLAGFMDAPVLLTKADSLTPGVADFIEDYGVESIYVLGGSAAIADSVLEDMEALANEPSVQRIEGADRYATAAAIASQLGASASWCGGDEVAALLVSGESDELINAVMVGPIAHRLQLPVLMTAADGLPDATADFIEAESIEQIVIVGGTDSVSEDIETALADAGVSNVDRIAGDTPAATSVALAELMTDDSADSCMDDLAPVSTDTVALVHRDALPDGVTAAPVLASTYANSGDLVPILIVGDTLPASVRDYLTATPAEYDNGDKINLSIVAIGGTAAVSASVMEAATAAAQSDEQLTVQISGSATVADASLHASDPDADAPADPGQTFWLHFSDDIATKDVETKIRDMLEINGVPARLGILDVEVVGFTPARKPIQHAAGDNDQCNLDVIQVTLIAGAELKVGNTVSIVESGIKLGDSDDERTVVPTSETVQAAADTTRPTVSIEALVGQPGFRVTVTDSPDPMLLNYYPDHLVRNTRDSNGARVFTFVDANDDESAIDIVLDAADENKIGSMTGTLTDQVGSATFTFLLDQDEDNVQMLLERRDRITVKNAVFEDAAGNRNRSVSVSAVVPPQNPKITSVRMSDVDDYRQMEVKIKDSVAGEGSKLWIKALSDGAAAGAAGNDWSFVVDKASTWDKDNEIDIDVRVNRIDNVVSARINNGTIRYDDFVDALNDHSGFSSMFEAFNNTTEVTANEPCGRSVNNKMLIADLTRQVEHQADRIVDDFSEDASPDARADGEVTGESSVGIETNFNGYVNMIHQEALFFDVFAATLDRTKVNLDNGDGGGSFPDNGILESGELTAGRTAYDAVVGTDLKNIGDGTDTDTGSPTVATATKQLRFNLWVTDVKQLPTARDVVTTAGGKDQIFKDDPDTDRTEVVAVAVVDVATGFIDDLDTPSPAAGTDVADSAIGDDERLNASSQVRIFESTSVAVPGVRPTDN